MKNQNKNRKSIRIKEFDYSEPGDYFVTICTKDREDLFGEIKDSEMVLNEIGKIAEKCWLEIPKHFPNAELDIFQIMPNHVHFIITILCDDCRGTACRAPTVEHFGKPTHNSIPTIVRSFKSAVTYLAHKNDLSMEWQRNYYEHIIRNQQSYDEIYTYIQSNPQMWDRDRNNPQNI